MSTSEKLIRVLLCNPTLLTREAARESACPPPEAEYAGVGPTVVVEGDRHPAARGREGRVPPVPSEY